MISGEFESMNSAYLWFDRILEVEKGVKAIAEKSVSLAENFFVDHFPRLPVMPGMLQLEGLIQLGNKLIIESIDNHHSAIPQSIKGIDFRKYVKPGDQLILEVVILSLGPENAIVKARATVDGKMVANVKEINYQYVRISSGQVTG